jgi:hypothetical protein
MPKLDRIFLINAAGFDDLEFPVGGHSQVIGVNGHGKSTLLRTVLFFYLGTNDKAPYALHETKADFVSHYLGDPPSYLIYEVARGNGEPAYHIAVTRPAGRIQFHFVDAPYQREYYVEGHLVRPIEAVHDRLREAQCAFDTVLSYEEFSHRIYGIVPTTYAVFRPALRGSGQVGVLPRIISGIFTVSQLDADKLKSALTCGVRQDSLTTELDLVLLKNQLENFRRVNRAVKAYLRHEQEAIDLVGLAEEFEAIKSERQHAIEELIRMAKLLPEKSRELEEQIVALERDQTAAVAQYENEDANLSQVIEKWGKELAVLENKIAEGERISDEYNERQIERKSKELERLPALREESRVAEQEYAALTSKFEDENQRKQRLLMTMRESWTQLRGEFERHKTTCERQTREKMGQIEEEKTNALSAIEQEQLEMGASLTPRRTRLDADRSALNNDFKALSKVAPPKELEVTRKTLEDVRQRQSEEAARQERLRNEIGRENEKSNREREKLEREAETERDGLQTSIDRYNADRERIAKELESFDESLAHYFQTETPESWPSAAKTINRETLFRSATDLGAKTSAAENSSAWGVQFSAEKLPEPRESYSRDELAVRLQELRRNLSRENDLLQAARERYLAESNALDKQAAQMRRQFETQLAGSVESRRSLLADGIRLENKILTLQSQFDKSRVAREAELDKRAAELEQAESALRQEQIEIEGRFRSRKNETERSFKARKERLNAEAVDRLAEISRQETAARHKHEGEVARVEEMFRQALSEQGVDTSLIQAAHERTTRAKREIERISLFQTEVTEYSQKKRGFIDPLPSLRAERQAANESLETQNSNRSRLRDRHAQAMTAFKERRQSLDNTFEALNKDNEAAGRFRGDIRFFLEWDLFDREDLTPSPFYRAEAVRDFLKSAEAFHQRAEQIGKDGNNAARKLLNRFDPETLDRKVLGFSPIHEHFDWFIFVGAELKPFVDNRGIQGMKQIQTQEFEQLIRNVCAKNADFREGVRQVNQTANLVQNHLRENNFVDVLDSVELKVDRVDNNLTQVLGALEEFGDVTFGSDGDLFGKRADRAQIDRAIGTFERLLREIDSYQGKSLLLTDYFDFLIRVHSNTGRGFGNMARDSEAKLSCVKSCDAIDTRTGSQTRAACGRRIPATEQTSESTAGALAAGERGEASEVGFELRRPRNTRQVTRLRRASLGRPRSLVSRQSDSRESDT